MKYILDTNICIYIINGKPDKILRKFERYPVYEFGISLITHAELQYGVEKSKNKNINQVLYLIIEFKYLKYIIYL